MRRALEFRLRLPTSLIGELNKLFSSTSRQFEKVRPTSRFRIGLKGSTWLKRQLISLSCLVFLPHMDVSSFPPTSRQAMSRLSLLVMHSGRVGLVQILE